MKATVLFIIASLILMSCQPNKQQASPQLAAINILSGHTFINTDSNSTVRGLYFENDSIIQPLYKVTFDTVFNWKYKVVNQSLCRYSLFSNELIAKDSIISINDSLLVLGSFIPDTHKQLNLRLAKKSR